MTEQEYKTLLLNQEVLPDNKVDKYIKRIVEHCCQLTSLNQFKTYDDKILKVLEKERKRVFYLIINDDGDNYRITNPKYKSEFEHVIGLDKTFWGVVNNEFLIENFDKKHAIIYRIM